jgi:hypothetical protein
VLTAHLEWGDPAGLAALDSLLNSTDDTSNSDEPGISSSSSSSSEAAITNQQQQRQRVEVVVGADVVCWPVCVTPLLETAKALFLALPDPFEGAMYVGYVCRATNTRDLFFATAKDMGFRCDKIAPESFLPLPPTQPPPPSSSSSSPSSAFSGAKDVDGGGDDDDGDGAGEPGNGEAATTAELITEKKGWPMNIRSQYDLELYRIALDPAEEARARALAPPALAGLPSDAYSLPF